MRSISARSATWAAALLLTLLSACSKESSGPSQPFDGGWTGQTSQSQPLALLVADGSIVVVTTAIAVSGASCADTLVGVVGRDPTEAAFAVTNGQFTVSWTTSLGSRTLTGTLDGSTATGTLTVVDTFCGGNLHLSWTATKSVGAQVNLAGTWTGEFSSSQFSPTPGEMILSQSGSALTGSWNAQSGGFGTVSGTVTGHAATFRLDQDTPGCGGSFDGYAVVVPYFGDLVFYYSGADCLGSHVNGYGFGQRAPLAAHTTDGVVGAERWVGEH